MERLLLTSAIAATLALNAVNLPVAAQGNGQGFNAGHNTVQIIGGTLTDQDKTELQFLREEEKLARDVYLTLGGIWNAVVFQNIATSEQRHTDTALQLLNAYQIPDLALADIGKFYNTTLQDLYNTLITRGQQSLTESLLVGALVEEVDINDLQKMLNATKNPDLIKRYSQLLQASYRHLNSFTYAWKAQTGQTYQAQVLPQVEVDRILGCAPLTVDANFQIHIPSLKYANMDLWANLSYLPNTANEVVFQVMDYGASISNDTCTVATLSPLDLSLKTPIATFKHRPSSDGKLYFVLDNYTP